MNTALVLDDVWRHRIFSLESVFRSPKIQDFPLVERDQSKNKGVFYRQVGCLSVLLLVVPGGEATNDAPADVDVDIIFLHYKFHYVVCIGYHGLQVFDYILFAS